MIQSEVLGKITQGMYVLTAEGGGCVVDAVAQVSGGDEPLIAVSVMKKNFTNERMKASGKFALSILGTKIDPAVIRTFGFVSMREKDKFAEGDLIDKDGLKIVSGAIGYLILEKVDLLENETHTLFLGRVKEAERLREGEPMSYGYYREHKDELMKMTSETGKAAWVCTVCGYVYYGETLPSDYVCPVCNMDASYFEKQN